jgi:hypothetical protein
MTHRPPSPPCLSQHSPEINKKAGWWQLQLHTTNCITAPLRPCRHWSHYNLSITRSLWSTYTALRFKDEDTEAQQLKQCAQEEDLGSTPRFVSILSLRHSFVPDRRPRKRRLRKRFNHLVKSPWTPEPQSFSTYLMCFYPGMLLLQKASTLPSLRSL